MEKIAVAVGEDSRFFRTQIVASLNDSWRFAVCVSADSLDALSMQLRSCSCEVLLLSASLGPDVPAQLAEIMRDHEVPVIIMAQDIAEQKEVAMRCLELGAIDHIIKPSDTNDPEKMSAFLEDLSRIIKRSASSRLRTYREGLRTAAQITPGLDRSRMDQRPTLIAFGASTGGPGVLFKILKELDHSIPAPILIVQHMPNDFLEMFSQQLALKTGWKVRLTGGRTRLSPSTVYVAAGGQHMVIVRQEGELWAIGQPRSENDLHCPSIDVTFSSLAKSMAGSVCAVLLTGMGEDGAQGLKNIHSMGGTTIAEDQSTALIYGMPAVAAALGAVKHMLPSYEIPGAINAMFERS